MNDPLPLSAGQIRALASAVVRELAWGLGAASREIVRWRARADAIVDAPLREDALRALADKRMHILGAALFSTLPRHRDLRLVRLLVAFETMLEFLDNVHERSADRDNGMRLHRALTEALDPAAPMSDHYGLHPWRGDGGYLRALVGECREACASLPSYAEVRPFVVSAAGRCAQAQSENHVAAQLHDSSALRRWAQRDSFERPETSWWESSAAACSSVGIHALLALAAGSPCGACARVSAAYDPWICAVSTMLDSYVDEDADAADGQHSYVRYYPSHEAATRRMCELIERSAREARGLPDGWRHAAIVACMVAMYLSNDNARTPARRQASRRLACAGGSLTRSLVPVLRVWRVTSGHRAV